MPKRTDKSLTYVEPPPTEASSGPCKGVWSDTSGIAIIDNSRGALRRAISDALHQLPPDITEAISSRVIPLEILSDPFQTWMSRTLPLRFTASLWQARQWTREILRSRRGEPLPEESTIPRPVIVGTAELHVEKIWRFEPGWQSKDIVRAGILQDFTRELDRELDARYAEIERLRPRPSSRHNLDRDARWLVLREFLRLSDDEIRDYEAGYPVRLETGQILRRLDVDPDAEDELPLIPKAGRRERDTINKAIKNLAREAGLCLSPRPKGRPPNLLPQDDPNWDYLA